MSREPIRFWHFAGYRRFCARWWKDLAYQLTLGLLRDIHTYWQRARHGWAPRDCWSLDVHIAKVFGEALIHLSDTSHGTPSLYPHIIPPPGMNVTDWEPDHDLWRADLKRWGEALVDFTKDDYYERFGRKYDLWHAEEKRRSETLHRTLKEIEPWFEALWD